MAVQKQDDQHEQTFSSYVSIRDIVLKTHPDECPGYDKQFDEVQVMLELWGMRSTPSLPSLPGPLWPRTGAPDRALSMG